MSLLPLIFSNWLEDLDEPHRLLDQDFGLSIHPNYLFAPPIGFNLYDILPKRGSNTSRCPVSAHHRPWEKLLRKGEGGTSIVKAEKDNFQVVLDVQHFAPEEINVKVVDRYVVVEGKHEEKQDEHGLISRQFTRRYIIPEQCNIDQISSKLSSDGVLSICVPRKQKESVEGERVINIEQTGKPAVREAPEEEKKDEDNKETDES